MKTRSMYNSESWVLAVCSDCGRTNYVEPHGTTAECRCSKFWTHHDPIPFGQRADRGGLTVMIDSEGRVASRNISTGVL